MFRLKEKLPAGLSAAAFVRAPLRKQITRSILATSFIVLLIVVSFFSIFELREFDRTLRQRLQTLSRITADNASAALAFDDNVEAQRILEILAVSPMMVQATLRDKDGKIVAQWTRPGLIGQGGAAFRQNGIGSGYYSHSTKVQEGQQFLGTLEMVASRSELGSRFGAYLLFTVTTALLGGLIAVALAWWLQRKIMKPVNELLRVTRTVARTGDYTLRARAFSESELGEITQSFNNMLERVHKGNLEKQQHAEEIMRLNETLEERVARRTLQLEEANRELESFSYSVSHDLRAPLRHVQGYADMLAKSAVEKLDERQSRYLKTISDAASDMGRLIDDLLSFSRMGRKEMREAMVDLNDVISSVLEELSPAMEGREIEWSIQDIPAVRGDPTMLRLVMQNLLDNAVKYTRQREVAKITVSYEEEGNGWLRISVADNGAGFKMQYYDKLFGVFQRLHRQEEFEGTGIGLANVRRVLSRHGGRIWAESEPEVGSTFTFTLQAAEAELAEENLHERNQTNIAR